MKKITVAIDGFSSCGKSTMAKSLAKSIGYAYVDSGAMYRVVALYCIQHGFFDEKGQLDVEKLESNIEKIKIDFKLNTDTKIADAYLNGVDVESAIRTMEVSDKVSIVSAISFVREHLVALQQEMGKQKGIVMDGRDIGTVVFPGAEMKIFVTAKPEIRAQRRLNELVSKGDSKTTFEEVFTNLEQRDHMDMTRKDGPLKKADDALLLDNSDITIAEQMQWLLDKFKEITG